MSGDAVPVGPTGRTRYRCVTGHEIPEDELGSQTEIVTLDGGAVIRQCSDHGAPVAMLVTPQIHG